MPDTETTNVPRTHRLPATPETVHTGYFDQILKPVLTVDSGDTVSIETMMLMDDQLQPELTVEELARIRTSYAPRGVSGHSLTGPIYVNGAEPGDVLEVRIRKLVLYPFGINFILPGEIGAGTLPEEFPQGRTMGFRWQDGDEEVAFSDSVRLPLKPFLGTMGVAPEKPGRHNAFPPGAFAGNIDLKELVEGTTLYLPVFVPGALFSTGDAHALQGDGEVCTTALEASCKEALLQFVVRKDMKLRLPLAETPAHWITMGFHADLDEAARIALREAISWLAENRGMSREEAYSLCSLAVDLRITQLVDGQKGVHAMIPKSIFKS